MDKNKALDVAIFLAIETHNSQSRRLRNPFLSKKRRQRIFKLANDCINAIPVLRGLKEGEDSLRVKLDAITKLWVETGKINDTLQAKLDEAQRDSDEEHGWVTHWCDRATKAEAELEIANAKIKSLQDKIDAIYEEQAGPDI